MKLWHERFEILKKIIAEAFFYGDIEGIKPKATEEALGLSRNKWQKWMAGQVPGSEDMARLVTHLGVSAHWLLTGEGTPFAEQPSNDIEAIAPSRPLRPVPMLGLASCGVEGWNQVMSIAVSASPLAMTANMFAIIAAGESMVPAGIASGQICYCDPDLPPLEGDAVYLERQDNMATIKLYLGAGERAGWIRLKGWHSEDEKGHRKSFFVDIPQAQVKKIAPVLYVRRRL